MQNDALSRRQNCDDRIGTNLFTMSIAIHSQHRLVASRSVRSRNIASNQIQQLLRFAIVDLRYSLVKRSACVVRHNRDRQIVTPEHGAAIPEDISFSGRTRGAKVSSHSHPSTSRGSKSARMISNSGTSWSTSMLHVRQSRDSATTVSNGSNSMTAFNCARTCVIGIAQTTLCLQPA